MIEVSEEARDLVERGLSLRFSDQELAFDLFRQAVEIEPHLKGMIEGIIGSTLWHDGNPQEAIQHLKKAVKLKPLARGSSVALFHSYIDMGMVLEATREAQRFFSAFAESGLPNTSKIREYEETYKPFRNVPECEMEELGRSILESRLRER